MRGMNDVTTSRCFRREDYLHLLLLLPVAAALFGLGIGTYDLWPADEPRFGQVAREMFESGNYISLTVNGESYSEKPPLLFWSMAALAHVFGDVNEMAARLPSVVGGVLGVFFTYALATRQFGPRVALWAALILMTSFRYWWQARTAQTDMLIAAFVAGAMYCLWCWDEVRRAGWLVAAYGCLAAAMYAKGPPALVFVVLGTWFFYRKEPFSRKGTHWVLGCAVALFLVALWYVPSRLLADEPAGASAAMGDNLFRNIIGRLFLGASKVQPPWYYFTTIPADLLPWTLFLPWVVAKAWRERKDNRAMHFLLAWSVPALIFFSISIGKRATYILPLFPIFAILTARGVLDFMDSDNAVWRKRLSNVWVGAMVVMGAVFVVVPSLEVQGLRVPEEHHLWLYLFGVLLFLFAVYAALRHKYAHRSPLHRVIMAQMALFLLAAVAAVFPVVNVFQSARAFCGPLRYLSEQGEAFRLYSVGFSREAYIYYSKHPHEAVLVDLPGSAGLTMDELYALAKTHKEARGLIQAAVEPVPVAKLDAVTPEELAALRAAIETAVAAAGDRAAALRAAEGQLQAVLDGFAATFGGDSPAFMFVQDDDWRWLLPLFSQLPKVEIVRQQRVGSREVLLIANEQGKALLARHLTPAALS